MSLVECNQPTATEIDDRARVGIGIRKAIRARPDARRDDAYVMSKPTQRGRQIKNVTLDAAGAADVIRT
jgi:hypothetical protein